MCDDDLTNARLTWNCRGVLFFGEALLQLQAARPRVQRMPPPPHHREYVMHRDRSPQASLTLSIAKQCYHCQGLGHVQADCPTLRLSGAGTSGRCYSCGLTGHLARNCPNPGMGRGAGGPPRGGYGGFRGGFAGGARPATCYKCGGPNHFARDCQAQAMKCYACGKLGHISRDCTAPNGGPLNTAGKTCYRCGETGHISRDCTQAEVNGDGGAPVPAAATAPAQPVVPTTAVA
ncbi:gig suppressor [Ascochyta rabiei]|uniref:gig suppressor n=1 Tax=Didymella rabiei TaxID=5454 RepID=UPI0021FD4913|nr:gig suppressor [Ascochyta rabiei]UPX13330.1 gig suppressor [Ascochyta rabiei]